MPRRVPSPTLKTGGCEGRLSCGSHRYSPQKVRPEDGGERLTASNRPARIPAELRSRNRKLEPNLLINVGRKLTDGGW